MGSTRKELVADLLLKPDSQRRTALIRHAQAGDYHDFDTPWAMPKVQLNADLLAAGFTDLAAKVRNGDYDDEQPTVEQLEELRQEVGPKFFDAMMGDQPRSKN